MIRLDNRLAIPENLREAGLPHAEQTTLRVELINSNVARDRAGLQLGHVHHTVVPARPEPGTREHVGILCDTE